MKKIFNLYSLFYIILLVSHYFGILNLENKFRFLLGVFFVFFAILNFLFKANNSKSDDDDNFIIYGNSKPKKPLPPDDFDSVEFMKDLNNSIKEKEKKEKELEMVRRE